MGYRPRASTLAPACRHQPVPVDLVVTGETVAWLCSRCLETVPAPPRPPRGPGAASPRPCRCAEPEVSQVKTLGGHVLLQRCASCSGVLPGMVTTW